jgi:hypothetical protein
MLPKIGVKSITYSRQNIAFWTFFETTRVSAISAGHRDSENKMILLFLNYFWTIKFKKFKKSFYFLNLGGPPRQPIPS